MCSRFSFIKKNLTAHKKKLKELDPSLPFRILLNLIKQFKSSKDNHKFPKNNWVYKVSLIIYFYRGALIQTSSDLKNLKNTFLNHQHKIIKELTYYFMSQVECYIILIGINGTNISF